jgi:hypothetical protein
MRHRFLIDLPVDQAVFAQALVTVQRMSALVMV